MEALSKGQKLFAADGCCIYATDDEDLAIMEWDDDGACRLAEALAALLKRHVVLTNFVGRQSGSSLVVRRLEPLPVKVVAEPRPGDVALTFVDGNGEALEREELLRLPGMKKARQDVMEDVALHVARCLRAHLPEAEGFRLRLDFGIASGGGCLMAVLNPLTCEFGGTDYDTLCGLLGGQRK